MQRETTSSAALYKRFEASRILISSVGAVRARCASRARRLDSSPETCSTCWVWVSSAWYLRRCRTASLSSTIPVPLRHDDVHPVGKIIAGCQVTDSFGSRDLSPVPNIHYDSRAEGRRAILLGKNGPGGELSAGFSVQAMLLYRRRLVFLGDCTRRTRHNRPERSLILDPRKLVLVPSDA
jgi:hypothetical protein